jgi:hypothetical protein
VWRWKRQRAREEEEHEKRRDALRGHTRRQTDTRHHITRGDGLLRERVEWTLSRVEMD